MINIDNMEIGQTIWLPADFDTQHLLSEEIKTSPNQFEVEKFEEELSCTRTA